MLQQKASEPTRNSLWENQDEMALGKGFTSSTNFSPHSKQLSGSFLYYSPSRPSAALVLPLVHQSSSCDGKCPCSSPDLPPLWFSLLKDRGLQVSTCIVWLMWHRLAAKSRLPHVK